MLPCATEHSGRVVHGGGGGWLTEEQPTGIAAFFGDSMRGRKDRMEEGALTLSKSCVGFNILG